MTNYIMDKEKLRDILLLHKSFIKETNKITDDFIETMINKFPIDNLLDQIDDVMKETVGYTSKEMMDKNERK